MHTWSEPRAGSSMVSMCTRSGCITKQLEFFNLYICSKLITESFQRVRSCLCCVEDMESMIWAQSLWNLYVVEETDETQHSKAQVVMQEESQQIKGFSGGSWLQNEDEFQKGLHGVTCPRNSEVHFEGQMDAVGQGSSLDI